MTSAESMGERIRKIRKVNGFSEKAIITTVYDACEHKTTVTVKGGCNNEYRFQQISSP